MDGTKFWLESPIVESFGNAPAKRGKGLLDPITLLDPATTNARRALASKAFRINSTKDEIL